MKFSSILRRLGQSVRGFLTFALTLSLAGIPVLASSHSEAPLISMDRYADNTDTYAFRSTQPGREGFVTLMANYIPFQEPSGGPQFYRWDDTVLYEIHVDNTGDGVPNITYQFRFQTQVVNGETVLGMAAVNQDGVINNLADVDYNMPQTYSVTRIVNSANGKGGTTIASNLRTPPSNIGPNTTPNYEANLGSQAVYPLPNGGKVFAGQRDEYFYIDLGGVFDRLALRAVTQNTDQNFDTGGIDTTQGYNVSSIAIEVPIQELTRSGSVPASSTAPDAVVGVWATASRSSTRVLKEGSQKDGGRMVQVSRLGNPLVNEVVIPLKLKDAFNAKTPEDDSIAAPFVLDPQLAQLLKAVYGIEVPAAPRNDLVSIFATGIPVNGITGPNYTTFLSDGVPHEYLRLNVGIAPSATPNRLGLLGGDVAGFPNGRRPFDDVTDIALRAVAGGTPFTPEFNVYPNNALGDGVSMNPEGPLMVNFPYLRTPNPGNTPRSSNVQGNP